MSRIYFFFAFLLTNASSALSQKEASVWYFGHNSGLSFVTGNPVVLSNGKIYTDEGVAAICDAGGNLLFYTEGEKVWNANHTVMPNGQGLLGTFTSSQSAIVVPKINDPLRYYIFTVDQLGRSAGLNYSIVNMNLDNGRGDVEVKNWHLQSFVCEKLTAVRHCNGLDIWVIVHLYDSDAFYAFLVTSAGVSITPVISHAGIFVSGANVENSIGCMKVSPDGKKIAAAHHHLGVDLLDFNSATGIVSNGMSLFLPSENYSLQRGPYGIEFAPHSKLLYITADYFNLTDFKDHSILLQYNVTLPDQLSIQASKQIIYEQPSYWYAENFGTLQIAPDGKMYMAELGQPFISVINNPDLAGSACQFVHGQQQVWNTNGGWSTYGLPNFIQSIWRPEFSFRGDCNGNLIYFDYERSPAEFSVKWDFGDPLSGAANISLLDSCQHIFSNGGVYTVKLIRYTACGPDTVIKQVSAGPGQVSLGADTTFCGISQYVLQPQTSGTNNSYLWQDGSTGPAFTATTDGLYWVEVKNNDNGCIKRDSINLLFRQNPQFDLGPDLDKCEGQQVTLSASVNGATYLWNNGSTGNSLQITQSGIYWLEASVSGCKRRDSVRAVFYQYPSVNLGKDTTLCEDQPLLLDAQNPGMNYLWQNNFTGQTLTVNSSGTYSVRVTNNSCSVSDTIKVAYLKKPVFTLGDDLGFCEGMSIVLQPRIQNGTNLIYLWSNGSTSSSITANQTGIYSLTITNDCGSKTNNIEIKKGVCQIYVPNGFSPNNDGLNDVFKAYFGENITVFSLQVYNRWGEKVFESNDINKGWNGKYKGMIQDSNLYIWLIRYRSVNDATEKKMKGTVMLIH